MVTVRMREEEVREIGEINPEGPEVMVEYEPVCSGVEEDFSLAESNERRKTPSLAERRLSHVVVKDKEAHGLRDSAFGASGNAGPAAPAERSIHHSLSVLDRDGSKWASFSTVAAAYAFVDVHRGNSRSSAGKSRSPAHELPPPHSSAPAHAAAAPLTSSLAPPGAGPIVPRHPFPPFALQGPSAFIVLGSVHG